MSADYQLREQKQTLIEIDEIDSTCIEPSAISGKRLLAKTRGLETGTILKGDQYQ